MACREGIDPADFVNGVDPGDADPVPLLSINDATRPDGLPGAYKMPDGTIWADFKVFVTNIDFANSIVATYNTADDTAIAGAHYIAQVDRTVVLPVGYSDVTIRVPILPGNPLFTGIKQFTVTLSAPDGAALGDAVAVGVIDYDTINDVVPPPDLGFPRMSMWWPWGTGVDLTAVTEAADNMIYMHQTGVVLRGMDWSPPGSYALPAAVSSYLDVFLARGIKPFLGLWVAECNSHEKDTALAAIADGHGKWAGIVIDAETQWVNFVQADESVAHSNFNSFMAAIRPKTSTLAYAPYASATSFPNYKYSWWNEQCDFALPQAYFDSPTDSGDNVVNTMYRKMAEAAVIQDWTQPPKPIVPLMNAYGADTDDKVGERREYMDIAFAVSRAVSIWRWFTSGTGVGESYVEGPPTDLTFATKMLRYLHTVPAEGGGQPVTFNGWPEQDRVTYDQFGTNLCAYDAACTGYAGAAAMSALWSAQGRGKVRFDAQTLFTDSGGVLCTSCHDTSCADGTSPGAVVRWMNTHGVQLLDLNPENLGSGRNYTCKSRDNGASHNLYEIQRPVALGGAGVNHDQLITKIKNALLAKHSVFMASIFYSDWNDCRTVDNHILRPHGTATGYKAHAWVIYGWDDNVLVPNNASIWGPLAGQRVGCFRIQSSHGCAWGESGRGLIPYSYLIPTWADSPAVRYKYWELIWAGAA